MTIENQPSNSDVMVAAVQYPMTMLLQRLEAAGQIQLKEMIAGVENDQKASQGASLTAHETFGEALRILQFANTCGQG
jgi:hypothetical protein